MLEVEHLTVRYGAITAVRDVSLAVQAKEFVALVGPNAAGKTTLLKTICGLLGPAAGEIRLKGKSLVGLRPEEVVRSGVSLVPEGRHVFHSLTVRENLMLASLSVGANGKVPMDRVFNYFPALFNLLDRRASTLSGGEQQMLAIGRGLIASPTLLLLDEPSLGLGPKVVEVVRRSLVQLHRDGTAILLVEQQAQSAVQLADRTYVLQKGSLVGAAERGAITRDDLTKAFLLGHTALETSASPNGPVEA